MATTRTRRVSALLASTCCSASSATFEPFSFGTDAARRFGRMSAAVFAAGRTPRRRVADLMIAATAAAEGLALYTTNPDDFLGLDGLVAVVTIERP